MVYMHFGYINPATQIGFMEVTGKEWEYYWNGLKHRPCTGFNHKAKHSKHWAQHSISKMLWLYPVCNKPAFSTYIQMFSFILQVAPMEKFSPVEF